MATATADGTRLRDRVSRTAAPWVAVVNQLDGGPTRGW